MGEASDRPFSGNSSDPGTNYELWETDGTESGTKMFIDLAPDDDTSTFPADISSLSDHFVFLTKFGNLWYSDGTPEGTVKQNGSFGKIRKISSAHNDQLFLNVAGSDRNGYKEQQWVIDGPDKVPKKVMGFSDKHYRVYFYLKEFRVTLPNGKAVFLTSQDITYGLQMLLSLARK